MKVGKEGVAGAIAALEAWGRRNHGAEKAREMAIVDAWMGSLGGVPGLALRVLPDWTGNPIDRVEVTAGEGAGLHAWELADRLARRNPSIRVRDDLIETGVFHLDPCNLDDGEARLVAAAIREEVAAALARGDGRRQSFAEHQAASFAASLHFPD
jgi:L-seryl-tRNA(Ser) seleniumtransferase